MNSDELRDEGTNLERLRNLSDGVFAIVLTLLVLNLNIPKLDTVESDMELLLAVGKLGPVITGYIISFFLIGIYWMSHVRVFRHIVRYNRRLLILNLVFLFWVSVLPFTTVIDAAKPNLPLAWTAYASSVGLAGFSLVAIWGRSNRDKLTDAGVSKTLNSYVLCRILIMPVIMSASVPIAHFPTMTGWVHAVPILVPIALWIVDIAFKQRSKEKV